MPHRHLTLHSMLLTIAMAAALAVFLFAAPFASAAEGNGYVLDGVELSTTAGYRADKLDWNIAGDSSGANPNILSELKWDGLDIFEVGLSARKSFDGLYLRGSFDFGLIFSGSNQDSDYNGDNRTLEYSRSNNNASDGSVWDISLGAGYGGFGFNAWQGRVRVIPLAGFSYHKQNLTITDGFQTIPATGPFSGLDSTYDARWLGPWAGVDVDYTTNGARLYGSFEFHRAYYRGVANWNLRSDLQHPKSFEHTANGYGIVAGLGADYAFSTQWTFTAGLKYNDWRATDGVDRTFFSDSTTSDTRLNEVNWNSVAFTAGVLYTF